MILREIAGEAGLIALNAAWENPSTFAFLPAKASIEESWVRTALARLPEELATDHFALLTSGSTGSPKLVVGERRRAEALAVRLHEVQRSEPVQEAIATLPLTYCYSFVNQWLWARAMKRRFVASHGFARPDELLESLSDARDALLCLVAPQLQLFERHFGERAFPGVRRVHFAGGPFPAAQLPELARRFPRARFFNNYGCAEAMPRLTVRPVEPTEAGTLKSSDIGRPLEGVELRISEEGELLFRSPFQAVACFEEDRFRRLADADWIATGDRAEQAADGRFELLGRSDQVFKRYGEKVSLARLLDSLGLVLEGQAAFYREKDRMGEEGAVLLLSPAPSPESLRALQRTLRSDHPRAHWPLRIESVERLPLLANGKIDLSVLASLEGKSVHWRNRV